MGSALSDLNAKTEEEKQNMGRDVENMFGLLLYDQIYGIFEQQIGKRIEEKESESESANGAEFGLKWLKQMRREINRRYETKEAQILAAMQNIGKIARIFDEIGGTGDSVAKIVRAQIKLSLSMRWPRGKECVDGTSPNAAKVLAGFLQNEVVTDERGGGIIFDLREELCNFLADFGYSNLSRAFVEIDTDQTNSSFGGRSLMRTFRLIRPELETELGMLLEYADEVTAFGQTFEETVAKIQQIGAFALFACLYRALLAQCVFGWTEKSKKAVPILYREFMCPEEYIGYWLEQMSLTLEGKVEKAKRDLNGLLTVDRAKLGEMEGEWEENGGQNWAKNASRTMPIYKRKNSWKRKYLPKLLPYFGTDKRMYVRIAGEEPSQAEEDGTMAEEGRESPRGETQPNERQIRKAIELNERVATVLTQVPPQ